MRSLILTFLLSGFFPAVCVYAQSLTVSGYVEDRLSGERIPDVEIYFPDLERGTTTNQYGFYSFTSASMQIRLLVSHIAYESQEYDFTLLQDTTLNVTLVPREVNLDELEIVAPPNRMVDNVQMSQHNIEIAQIETLPVLLGEPDVQKVLQLLPGVQAGTEGSSGLYVRGGRADQNLILLDGLPVYNPNHLFGFFSVFPAQAMKNVKLLKGGFPARYGGRLSSVVDYTMKEGNMRQYTGQASIGILSSRVLIEGPIKKEKASFLLSGRRTFVDLFLGALDRRSAERQTVYFYDLHFKANYIASKRDRFYLSAYAGRDLLGYRYDSGKDQENADALIPDKSEIDTGWGNYLLALRWNRIIGDRTFINVLAGMTSYHYALEHQRTTSEPDLNEPTRTSEDVWDSGITDRIVKIDAEHNAGSRHYLRFGLEGIWHRVQPGRTQRRTETENEEKESIENQFPTDHLESGTVAAYVEDEIYLSRKFRINIGLRASGYFVDGGPYWSIEPRLNASLRLSEYLAVKISAVSMQQYIHLLTQGGARLPNDLWVPSTERINPQRGQQVAAGLAYSEPNGRYEISLETYWRRMQKLLEYQTDANIRGSAVLNWADLVEEGDGQAVGLEIFAQKKAGRWTGWVGYTLSKATRKFKNLNNGDSFPDGFDRRHDLSIVSRYQIRDQLEFSAAWVFGSGYPVWLPVGQYPIRWTIVMDFGPLNSSRAPHYHRLDVGFHFEKTLSWATRTFSIGMYNAYGRRNPSYIYVHSNLDQYSPGNPNTNPPQVRKVSLFQWIPSLSYQLEF